MDLFENIIEINFLLFGIKLVLFFIKKTQNILFHKFLFLIICSLLFTNDLICFAFSF